jgi:hypothetical protein
VETVIRQLHFVPSPSPLPKPATSQGEQLRYVKVGLGGVDEYVCLNQIRVVDHRRLYSKLGQIDTNDFDRVKAGFKQLYL